MKVSVVIPTYNSENTVDICLESIENQSYRNIEIIVVDRFSEDKTAEIAKEYKARVYKLDCERAKAKNFGLRRARGEVCHVRGFGHGADARCGGGVC
ncbi:glycosyltransferase family 2 protein [Archaeoglobus neptunius]|uniref:glycosyltransferase family 2 protein n=1 Tax=Archaeoglobus neptunius TaxID=2798580 RepID=UPI0019274C0F|nr:glycosyltransferase [Archaeoglobus neptunius]